MIYRKRKFAQTIP